MAGAYSPGDDRVERHVFGMWVAPEARRRGIGRTLLDAATAWSWDSGAEFATLWVVEGNDAAARLYEFAGFLSAGVSQPLPSHPHLIEWLMRASRPEGK